MALFYYQALERNGRKTKGMIEADSARHARQLLRGKDLIPVHIEARMNASAGGLLQRRRHAHRRVATADLALFTRQLATLVQAAMPLETCLQAVSEQSEKLHVKSLGMALRSRIQEGYTLSDSLREHPRVFDSLFCSMVAAGEKSVAAAVFRDASTGGCLDWKILDAAGKVLKKQRLAPRARLFFTLPTDELSPGNYRLIVETPSGRAERPFTVISGW